MKQTIRRRNAQSAILAFLAALLAWACPLRSQEAASNERTITVDGAERSFLVHVPPNVSRPAPMILVFHGGGGRPQGIERKTGMSVLADQRGFVVVYPAGSPAPQGGGTWNVGGSARMSDDDDVAFVKALVSDLEKAMPIDRSRIYATGHSMGGVFAYRLACEMSDTFAAIAAVSATMVEPSCQPSEPVAILHIHGTDDDRIPINGGRGEMTKRDRTWPAPQAGILSWSHLDSCSEQPARSEDGATICTTYSQCRATVEYCVIKGGEHAWPDGAAERVWTFFAAHPKAKH